MMSENLVKLGKSRLTTPARTVNSTVSNTPRIEYDDDKL